MPLDRRVFSSLDTDTAPERVENGRAAYLLNYQPGRGYGTTVRGNVALPAVALPAGLNWALEAVELPGTSGGIAWLVWNGLGVHSVVRRLPGLPPELLLSWAGLNLPAPGPTAYVAPTVVDNFLCYLDADGEARNLPLNRLAAGEYPPARLAAEPWGLHVVKVPPTQPLDVARVTRSGPSPLLATKLVSRQAWQFTYRYQYADGETTVLAPFSRWLDVLVDPTTASENAIAVVVPAVPVGVREIELLARQPGAVGWRVVQALRRDAAGTFPASYDFFGQTKGGVVQGDDATRPYEFLWPSRALTAARNRLWYGNTRVGYVTPEPAFTATVTLGQPTATRRTTLHQRCSYRVVVQFYDALGRPGGCSQAQLVGVPERLNNSQQLRSLSVALTTTGAAALNLEIPAWADTYQFLVADNDRTPYFLEGQAADALAYYGEKKTLNADGSVTYGHSFGDVNGSSAHQSTAVDISNFVPVGQGYVWSKGDILRFRDVDKEYPIIAQVGDYLIVGHSGGLPKDGQGRTVPFIEIYAPNTQPSDAYYERGPRLRVLRDAQGNRSYAQTQVELEGDCLVVVLRFPNIIRSPAYTSDSNNNKVFEAATDDTVVESMVPLYRLAPTSTTTTTDIKSPFPIALNADTAAALGAGTSTAADTVGRTAADLTWLRMSTGGRPGAQVPLALQQVELPTAVGFGGVRRAGSLLNGLSAWRAADQEELAREQGAVLALAPANDVQSEDQVLVAVCREGVVSMGINVGQARQADGGTITVATNSVIGYISSQKNQLGTRHPQSVKSRGGRLYWWSQDQGQVCRYAQDGTNPLNTQRHCRALGRELAAAYGQATVAAAYDLHTEEYVLCFGADPASQAPARTVRFSELEEVRGFVGDSSLQPEALVGTISQRLVAFRAGQAWEHDEAAPRMNFFGAQYSCRVQVWANENGALSKTWRAVEVESSRPRWELVEARTPSGQVTRTPAARMAYLDGRWEGPLLCDETSPGFTGPDAARRARYEGLPLQGQALLLTFVCTDFTAVPRLLGVGVTYFINGGQAPPN